MLKVSWHIISISVPHFTFLWKQMASENSRVSEESKDAKNGMRRQIIASFYVLVPLGIFAVIFIVVTFLTPLTQRGFYCNDDFITKPYIEEETISAALCAMFSILMVFGTIFAVDLYNIITVVRSVPVAYSAKSSNIQRYIVVTVECIVFLGFGVLIERSVVELTKRTIGELRPHFISVCFPKDGDYHKLCNRSYPATYIQTTCPGANPDHVKEARVSFPSGHSSFIFYGAVAGIVYIRSQLIGPSRGLVRNCFTAIQFGYFLLAWYVAISRIKDYWHHPWDVLSGATIGTVIPICIWFVSPMKTQRSPILRSKSSLNYLEFFGKI